MKYTGSPSRTGRSRRRGSTRAPDPCAYMRVRERFLRS
jgi:hypothetical protein